MALGYRSSESLVESSDTTETVMMSTVLHSGNLIRGFLPS